MKLLTHARIHTLDPHRPQASVLAVDGGRVAAAGGEELLDAFPGAMLQDLDGRVVLPGLIDAHLHLEEYALSLQMVDCQGCSQAECLARVAARARQTPPDGWIRGHGWNQNDWGGAWPSAADLETAAPGRPVYLTARSLHLAWVSPTALRLAGVQAATPDPPGGSIQRDAHGQPTGLLFENAIRLVEAVFPRPDAAALAELYRTVLPGLARLGLTGVHDFDRRTSFQALQLLHAYGELPLRVVKSLPRELLPQAVELGLRSGFGDDRLRIGPVKLFADGALGPHTAAMLAPYVDDPQNRGILVMDSRELFETGQEAVAAGLSLAVHAIGDRAVHEVLEGFGRLRVYERERGLPALRHRIEHVQLLHPGDAARLAELGLVASMQPIHAPSDMPVAERSWGARNALAYAWRTQLQAGVRLAFGSDAPVESPNPFLGLHAAVTRRRQDGTPGVEGWHPEQRLTVGEALEGFTLGPAYAAGMDDRLGRLAAGCLADLIVLDRDPFTCEPSELGSLQPQASMVDGEWVWQS